MIPVLKLFLKYNFLKILHVYNFSITLKLTYKMKYMVFIKENVNGPIHSVHVIIMALHLVHNGQL